MKNIKFYLLGFLAVSSILSMPVQGFKIDTHIWIGQQVINDLEDNDPNRINFELADGINKQDTHSKGS